MLPNKLVGSRLSGAEMADKRAKGLCFRCDERFIPGHRCANRTLQVLIAGSDDDEEDEPQQLLEEDHAHVDHIEVSVNSVVGLTPPRTMKLLGRIAGQQFTILIDSGATHNFMSPRVLRTTGFPVTPTKERNVLLGNGSTEHSGACVGMSPSNSQISSWWKTS